MFKDIKNQIPNINFLEYNNNFFIKFTVINYWDNTIQNHINKISIQFNSIKNHINKISNRMDCTDWYFFYNYFRIKYYMPIHWNNLY